MMSTITCEIAGPIDVLETEDGAEIVIHPWFDLAGVSQKLDRAWENCYYTRLKCCIPEDQEAFAYEHNAGDFDTLIMSCLCTGEYVRGCIEYDDDPTTGERKHSRNPGTYVEHDPLSIRIKPFAIARNALIGAIGRHTSKRVFSKGCR